MQKDASFADRLMVECLEPAVQLASFIYVTATLIAMSFTCCAFRHRILVASVRSKVSELRLWRVTPRAQATQGEAEAQVSGAPACPTVTNQATCGRTGCSRLSLLLCCAAA